MLSSGRGHAVPRAAGPALLLVLFFHSLPLLLPPPTLDPLSPLFPCSLAPLFPFPYLFSTDSFAGITSPVCAVCRSVHAVVSLLSFLCSNLNVLVSV